MKKILIFVVAIMLVASMAIPAHAVTPAMNVPDMPEIPEIKNVEVKVSENFWDNWFAQHPLKFDFAFIKFGG